MSILEHESLDEGLSGKILSIINYFAPDHALIASVGMLNGIRHELSALGVKGRIFLAGIPKITSFRGIC